MKVPSYKIFRGQIIAWDRETIVAKARLFDGRIISFYSTSYQSLPPTTWPVVGKLVDVIYNLKNILTVREVREVSDGR